MVPGKALTKIDLEDELCRILIRTGALKFGLFTLASGKLSPYYIDLRLIPSSPRALRSAITMYEEVIRRDVGDKRFDRIAGVPTAGITYASILAYDMGKPFLYVRKDVKGHGMEKRVEGMLLPGERVLLVDDLVTTGKSFVEATDAIRAEGGIVEDTVVLIDREEGGAESLKKMGVKLHAFATITGLARRMLRMGVIDKPLFHEILKQAKP